MAEGGWVDAVDAFCRCRSEDVVGVCGWIGVETAAVFAFPESEHGVVVCDWESGRGQVGEATSACVFLVGCCDGCLS